MKPGTVSYPFSLASAALTRTLCAAAVVLALAGCGSTALPETHAGIARDARPSAPPQLRYQVDAARERVWLLTGERLTVYESARPERTVIDLPGWQWLDGPYGCFPDLALGPNGEAVITSNIVPTVWRVDPNTLAVTQHPLVLDADADKDVGFSGLVYSPDHSAFFAVSYVHGSLWKIDPLLRRAQKVALSERIGGACGLAPHPRAERPASRLAGLCVRTPRSGRLVELAPDERSAYVKSIACGER